MLLKDMRIGFCLRGAKELWYSDWILKDYGPTVTVQCGSVWWATGYQPCAPNLHFDLSALTFYERRGSNGRMPYPDAPPVHNVQSFKYLIDV